MKCPSWLLQLVTSYLTKRTLILTYNGASSSEKHLPGGAPAGCLLGGLIFILKFNGAFLRPKIPRPIGQFFHAKYFDDVSAAASIDLKKSLRKDTIQRQRPLKYNENSQLVLPYSDNPLQKALLEIEEYVDMNKMKINFDKSKLLLFNRSIQYRFPLECSFSDGSSLEVVENLKILGVIVSNSLTWDQNTEYITKKAMSKLWTLRRLMKLGFDDEFIVEVYTKEIRPILEFGVPVWNGALSNKNSDKIENIQKIIARMVFKGDYSSYSKSCDTLKLEKLHQRRQILCLNFARKEYKKPDGGIFKKKVTRSKRIQHNFLVEEPKARTSSYTKSCLSYLSKLLNTHGE